MTASEALRRALRELQAADAVDLHAEGCVIATLHVEKAKAWMLLAEALAAIQ